jgi:hypothetical protein
MTKFTFPSPKKNPGAEGWDEVLISGVVFPGRGAAGLASVFAQR